MKRLISLLVVVFMICSALVGCKWGNVFNKKATTSHSTTVTTTESLIKMPIAPSFECGDNFTAEDVAFVEHLGRVEGVGEPVPYDFSEIIRMTGISTTLCTAKIDLQSNPYFICAYARKDAHFIPFSFDEGCGVQFLIWYKFNSYEDIPKEIDNQTFLGAFAIYDAVIETDIINNKEYNRKCKYYVPLDKGVSEKGIKFQYSLYENVVLRQRCSALNSSDPMFIQNRLYNKYAILVDVYGCYVDDSGTKYFVLSRTNKKSTDDSLDIESEISRLGSYHTDFIPHVEVFDATLDKDGFEGAYICIKLDTFFEICVEK